MNSLKRNTGLLAGITAIAIISATAALANEESSSSGTRGGGQTVDLNGRPALRDLVDKTNCEWWTGAEFQQGLNHWPKLLKTIDEANWFFATQIEKEAGRLAVCMTRAPLIQIPADDIGGLTVFVSGKTHRQVAIRWDDRIYLDGSTFDQMSQVDKAYLYLHEIMHSFIPMDTAYRYTKLRSTVATLRENEKNGMTPAHLDMQLKMNDVQTVFGVTEKSRDAYNYLNDEKVGLKDRIVFANRDETGKESCRIIKASELFPSIPCNPIEKIKSSILGAGWLEPGFRAQMIEALEELGYAFLDEHKYEVLKLSITNDDAASAKLAFEAGVNPLERTPDLGHSPLVEAVLSDSVKVLEYFSTVMPKTVFQVPHLSLTASFGHSTKTLLQWSVEKDAKKCFAFLINQGWTNGIAKRKVLSKPGYEFFWKPELHIQGLDAEAAILLAARSLESRKSMFKPLARLMSKQELELLIVRPESGESNGLDNLLSSLARYGEQDLIQYLIEEKDVSPCKVKYLRHETALMRQTYNEVIDPAREADQTGYPYLANYIRQKQEEQKCWK